MSQQQPLSLPSKKADVSSSSQRTRKRPWVTVCVALILAGAAAWFWTGKNPDTSKTVPSAGREAISKINENPPQTDPAAGQNSLPGQVPGQTASQGPSQAQDQASGQVSGQGMGQAAGQTPGQTAGQASGGQAGSQSSGQATAQTPGQSGAGSLPILTSPATREAEGQTTRGLVATEPQQPQDGGLSGRSDDAVVRPTFIDDLARWMVDNYIPASGRGGRGSIGIGIQSANARYGVGMKGLAWIGSDLPAGRGEALRYVYTPGMLDALYRLYIDRFMQAMAEAASEPRKNGKTLEPEQIAEMYRLYAGRLRTLSGTMQAVAALEDLRARVSRIQEASQKTVTANTKYMEEVFKFDQAREGNDQLQIENTRAAMEAASGVYLQTTQERDQLRDALIGAIRNSPGARGLSDDNLLYVALWIDRRLQQSPQALDATRQGAALFSDLAQHFERASGARP